MSVNSGDTYNDKVVRQFAIMTLVWASSAWPSVS
jgi:hypothetical protein